MTLASGTKLGPYEILCPLGAGGMGEVFRARDTRLGRDVAIKLVHPRLAADAEQLRRFEQEARAVAALNHPNIVALFDVGRHEQAPFVVTELLEGESLRDKLGSPLSPKKAVEYAIQIAQGLSAAHEKGIVHRDLKPENLFVMKDGRIKILDFGVAKLTQPAIVSVSQTEALTAAPDTEPGIVVGTVSYMSPEQLRGQAVDQRSDIFSFGCVVYEMLSGRRPFQKGAAPETMAAILGEEPPDLLDTNKAVSPSLERIVRHCLEKEPSGRFQSAWDVVFDLEALPEVSFARATAPSLAAVRLPRHRRLLAGAALVALAAAVALIFYNRNPSAVTSGPPSVLALPCKVYGAPDVAFLMDAVPGTIATFLSQVEGLDTKVPPTSLEVEKVKGDLSKLAEMYRVSSFIVTSIMTSPGRFALNVQLVDAATRKVRWGKQFEGPRESYSDLARQAAEGIRVAVRPAASPVPTATVSSEAELALREGDYFRNRYMSLIRPSDFDAGMAALTRALKADPSLADAMASIGYLYFVKFENEGETSVLKEVERWARRALDADSRSGRAWGLLSWVESHVTRPNIERQLEYALKAASFSPRDALSHMIVSNSVWGPGTVSLSLAAGLWGVDVDPFYLATSGNVVLGLSALGRPKEALPFADRIERVEPDWSQLPQAKGYMLLKLGRFAEARKAMERGGPPFLEHPESDAGQFWGQARFELAAAERDAATMRKLEPHILPPLLDGRADAFSLGNGVAFVCPALAVLGRTDEAIRILLRSIDAGIPPPYDWLLSDPDFRPLRGDPRFVKVLAASHDGAAGIARILEEARKRGELPGYLEAPLVDLQKLLKAKGTTSG